MYACLSVCLLHKVFFAKKLSFNYDEKFSLLVVSVYQRFTLKMPLL